MARKKVQKNINVPAEIAEWFNAMEWREGGSRGRIAIAALLAYELQSKHIQRFCMLLATAIEREDVSLDEALSILRIREPGMLRAPGSPAALNAKREFALKKYWLILIDEWDAWMNAGAAPGEKGSIDQAREREERFAEERWRMAEARLKEKLEPSPVTESPATEAVRAAAQNKPKPRKRQKGA